MSALTVIRAQWPAPSHVHAFTTTRHGGFSKPPFDGFNLGAYAGDELEAVLQNRRVLDALLPQSPYWIKQVHGTRVVKVQGSNPGIHENVVEADASFTQTPQTVLSILAADCMSVLLTNQAGTAIAAAHAGWRGLCEGVLENTVALFLQEQSELADRLIAWIGPSISVKHYEVGSEVRDAFLRAAEHRGHTLSDSCFEKSINAQRYMADLPRIAKERLHAMGVKQVFGGDLCTYSEPERFYSYRRQNPTGRFASLIWFNPKP
jgi:YfiH family protein